MAIYVKCRHCGVEMFRLSSGDVPSQHVMREEFAEQFTLEKDTGQCTIESTCETCEGIVQNNPEVISLQKWTQ